jgi:histidyl-tRNA synthetase
MTDTYKGVRDFYPEDQRVQNHLFAAMRRAVSQYGYEEYNASILEPTELYLAKSSEEIVTQQTYTFEDRGGRSVTLRPEMTPTVARMVAAQKRELGYPLRWYSIQNFFRYERPQRGRLREFWQLNVDLFGVTGIEADLELITVAHRVVTELGADQSHFVIKIGNRQFLASVYDMLDIPPEERQSMTRLLDAKDKGTPINEDLLRALEHPESFTYFTELEAGLKARGITNAVIDSTIARGFDYYTGMVFEVFDTHTDNKRAMFGGGRYDTLVEKYGSEPVAAVGFAMGDVTARDFLETHNLMPPLAPTTQLYLAPLDPGAHTAAETLRAHGVNVALGMRHEKISDHIRNADKLGIHYFAAYGENETTTGELALKNLKTGTETKIALNKVHEFLVQS